LKKEIESQKRKGFAVQTGRNWTVQGGGGGSHWSRSRAKLKKKGAEKKGRGTQGKWRKEAKRAMRSLPERVEGGGKDDSHQADLAGGAITFQKRLEEKESPLGKIKGQGVQRSKRNKRRSALLYLT